jgi:thymidylate synthase (FAD)
MQKKRTVLDKGFVELIDYMGDDLRVVNSAKISKKKESKSLNKNNKILIQNLAS